MPFSKETHSKGGQVPASELQKQTASESIKANKPWLKSTGPKTARGKAIASQNRNRAIMEIRSWEFPTLEQFSQAVALADSMLDQELEKLKRQGFLFRYRRYRRTDSQGTYLRYSFSVSSPEPHPALNRLRSHPTYQQLLRDWPAIATALETASEIPPIPETYPDIPDRGSQVNSPKNSNRLALTTSETRFRTSSRS